MKIILKTYFPLLLSALFLAGCTSYQLTTKHLEDDELLLKKNKIKIVGNKSIDKDELSLYVRQKPNRAILFGSWRLGLQWKNLWFNPTKDDPADNPAVVLDSSLVVRSEKQLEIFLQNQGYYNAEVHHKIRRTHVFGIESWPTKKAVVEYEVYPGTPLVIDSIGCDIPQKDIYSYYKNSQKNQIFAKGDVLKIEYLQLERERIVKDLQNRGYYDFAESYISFDVDSSAGKNKTVLITKIKQPKRTDSLHRRYTINNIIVQTDYNPYASNNKTTDTIYYQDVAFISKGASNFKPEPIYRSLFFKEGEYYNQKRQSITYRQLSNLNVFSYIKIDYKKVTDSLGRKILDVFVQLGPASKMSISTELMGIFREGFGVSGQVLFTKKNAFKRSEILTFSISGGFEDLRTSENRYASNIGPRLSVTFPRLFLFKDLTNRIRKNAFPKTTLSTYFNYQQRTQYTRYLTSASMKYEWNEGNYKKHELNVPDISFSFITKDSEILKDLNDLSKSQKFKFEDAISSGFKYTFTYNNQSNPKIKNADYLVLKGFLVGPSALAASALNIEAREATSNAITLFGVRYATFFKVQGDYRKYFNITKSQQLAFRGFAGVGIPLDKNGVIPFDQLYYAGGANSVRGWQQRTLGPGAFIDTDNKVDKLGEIKLEANIEYRFPITSILKGAVFVDAGNIWTEEDDDPTNSFDPNFAFDRFYKEIAVSPGLGIRFDFDFFLFRFDVGVPLKQAYNKNIWELEFNNSQYNFGVGYPF